MYPYVLFFCLFFIGHDIATSANRLSKNHEHVFLNLDNQNRWENELKEFTVGLKYSNSDGKLFNVPTGVAAPSQTKLNAREIKFELYTSRNRYRPDILAIDDLESLQKSNFQKEQKTIFVTHGWLRSGKDESCGMIVDAYLNAYELNVIVVDWSPVALDTDYPKVAAKVLAVGRAVADFMDHLSRNEYLSVNNAILIGHGLGAHVVGIAGYKVLGTPAAIFALDPTMPLHRFAAPGYRISDQDAAHVQIIHTNAGYLGTDERWGHVSFLVNGGIYQDSCPESSLSACSHSRAYEYFAESITSTVGFFGRLCATELELDAGACSGAFGRMGGFSPDRDLKRDQIYNVPVKMQTPFAYGR